MLRRSNLVSGGSVASARPLGTVRTLYPDIWIMSRGSAMMPLPSGSAAATPDTQDARDEVSAPHVTATFATESTTVDSIPWTPSFRSTASWVVYDLGDTVF